MLDEVIGRFSKKAHEFPKEFKWANSAPVTLESLKGHIIILDFWTYCCINCMHELDVLSYVEEHYKDKPVIIIGVHSAKYTNEKDPSNIEQAIARYRIKHPVIIDEKMHLWNSYGAVAWPTLVFIGPDLEIFYKRAGELSKNDASLLLDDALKRYGEEKKLVGKKKDIEVKKYGQSSTLYYPGKIAFSNDGKLIAISDSGNNRIIVADRATGRAMDVIGGGSNGILDGSFDSCRFSSPQGLAWDKNMIYIADTNNHCIRVADLRIRKVTTLAGTGDQGGYVRFGMGYEPQEVSLNSPWDLTISYEKLYIAMAGLHQIWVYDMNTKKIEPFAGSGMENIEDGDLRKAVLAQPSGLWISGKNMYIADSETSSIRSLSFENGFVSTIVGAGLFNFGNQDGNLVESKFQHPLGVCENNGIIYVADTYNNAVRAINIKENRVYTLVGRKEMNTVCRLDDPDCDTLGLYEPSDVKFIDDKLYITDTDNHLIRFYDLKSNILKTLDIKLS